MTGGSINNGGVGSGGAGINAYGGSGDGLGGGPGGDGIDAFGGSSQGAVGLEETLGGDGVFAMPGTPTTNPRGYYIHPELYGAPEEKQMEWARNPQRMERMKLLKERAQERAAAPKAQPKPKRGAVKRGGWDLMGGWH